MPTYTIELRLGDATRKLIVARDPEESEHHLSLKVLAYIIYFECQPKVEATVGQHYKPDLVCIEEDYVRLWIDCGDIGFHKLDRVSTTNHRARIVVVKPTARSVAAYKRQADKRVRRPERISYLSFDDGFLDMFVQVLSTRSVLIAAVDHERSRLELNLNGHTLETQIHRS